MSRAADLARYLAACRATPFRPGRHDCALFAAGWLREVTGDDPARGLRGKYTTLKGGARMLARKGIASHVDIVAARYKEIAPAMAQIGDIAVVDDDALGIVAGERIFVLHLAGLGSVELSRAVRVFRP